MTRLRFLEILTGICTAVLAALGFGGASRALQRPKGFGDRVQAWRRVLEAAAVPDEGGVAKVRFEGRTFLIRIQDDRPRAWDATCPHAGCAVDWEAQDARFFCACHSSYFDAAGEPLSGPAQRALGAVEARWGRGDVVELFV